MVQYKYVTIKCNGNELSNLKSVTSVDVSEEIDSDLVKTFDDPVPVPSSDGGYTIDIEFLATRDVDDFIILKRMIRDMKQIEGEIQVKEIHKRKTGDVIERNDFSGVLLSKNEGKYEAESLTARSLSFKAKTMLEYINNEQI